MEKSTKTSFIVTTSLSTGYPLSHATRHQFVTSPDNVHLPSATITSRTPTPIVNLILAQKTITADPTIVMTTPIIPGTSTT